GGANGPAPGFDYPGPCKVTRRYARARRGRIAEPLPQVTCMLRKGAKMPKGAEVGGSGPKGGPIALCPGSRLPVLRRNLPVWLRLLDAAGVPRETPMAIAVPEFLSEEAARLARENAPARWAEGEVAAAAAAQAEGTGAAPGLQV